MGLRDSVEANNENPIKKFFNRFFPSYFLFKLIKGISSFFSIGIYWLDIK